MKKVLVLIAALVAGLAGPATGARWAYPAADVYAQAGKGREARERAQRARDSRPERRPQREQRAERLSDEERRALHRDLDKANRELYQRRQR